MKEVDPSCKKWNFQVNTNMPISSDMLMEFEAFITYFLSIYV